MDELKRYIRQNAEELDIDEPGPGVWQEISRQTVRPKTNVVLMATRWALAACVLVLAGIGIWHLADDGSRPETRSTALVTPADPAPAETSQPVNGAPVMQLPAEGSATASVPVSTRKQNRTAGSGPVVNKADMRVLTDLENSFTQVINLQRARVSTIPMYAETPAYFDDFTLQLKQMEKDEKIVKADISRRGLNDALLGQLINLYQQKLNILKQLQIEMNKTNNRFKQNREPVDSTRTYFLNI